MPLFEYICRECGHGFEALVTASRPPLCPRCESQNLEKQLSVFAVSTRSAAPSATPSTAGACGACGDPRGPGACSMN